MIFINLHFMKLVYHDNSIFSYYSNSQTGYRGGALIGGCRERVTSCSGFLGADATERSLQREGHSLLQVLRSETLERGVGAEP